MLCFCPLLLLLSLQWGNVFSFSVSSGSTVVSKEHYDIVKVDLDGGRDYPIYIGAGYSDDEGMSRKQCRTMAFCKTMDVLVIPRKDIPNQDSHFVLLQPPIC